MFLRIVHSHVLCLITLFTLLVITTALLLPPVSTKTRSGVILSLKLTTVRLLDIVVTVFINAKLIGGRVRGHAILILLTGPIDRIRFVINGRLNLSTILTILLTTLNLVFATLLTLGNVTFSLIDLLLTFKFVLLRTVLLATITVLFKIFADSLLTALVAFTICVVNRLARTLINFNRVDRDPNVRQLAGTLCLILPSLRHLGLHGITICKPSLLPSDLDLMDGLLCTLMCVTLLLTVTAVIFSHHRF